MGSATDLVGAAGSATLHAGKSVAHFSADVDGGAMHVTSDIATGAIGMTGNIATAGARSVGLAGIRGDEGDDLEVRFFLGRRTSQ